VKEDRFGSDRKIILGCIGDELDFVALESKSTYSWIALGNVNAPTASAAKTSIHIASTMEIPNDTWASISSAGELVGRGPMASVNFQEYAKIESGIVTDIVSAKRGAVFPKGETWIVTPYDPSRGSGKIGRGYRYMRGHFFPPDKSS